jgi:hypothetical protein
MKQENELAMVVAFYLSKFGDDSLEKLGYRSYKQAFDEIGRGLRVKPNSVKNWRDEFDPYYDNRRKGWFRRNIRPSRQRVMTAFDDLSESALRAIVQDIIQPTARPRVETELQSTLQDIRDENKRKAKRESDYVPRGPTGRMAEQFFMARFQAGLTPFDGDLRDRRDDGVGFDFEIDDREKCTRVEVKGLAAERGGITFTDKEWKVANESQDDYFLGLVTRVVTKPQLTVLQNPALRFTPKYHAYTTVTVNWNISAGQIFKISTS